jgi:hypothetical protein
MPNNVVKAVSKQSGESTDKAEKDWEDAGPSAEKAGLKKDSDRYYAYKNSVMHKKAGLGKKNEMFNDNQMKNGIEAQGRAMNKPVDSKMVNNAFELGKTKADKMGLQKDSPDYWSYVTGEAGKNSGMYNDQQQETPLSFGQRDNDRKGAMDFQRESYVTFEKELERIQEKTKCPVCKGSGKQGGYKVAGGFESKCGKCGGSGYLSSGGDGSDYKVAGGFVKNTREGLHEITSDEFKHTKSPKNAGDRDEHLQGYSKIELAKEFAKTLKKKGLSRNEIIHAIVNRLIGIGKEDAVKIADGEDVDGIDNTWAPRDPVAPGYQNSIPSLYQDVDQYKETKKKSQNLRK